MQTSALLEHVRYHAWASRRMLDTARQLTPEEAGRDLRSSHGSVIGTLAHIYLADRMWWSRIHGRGRKTMTDPGEVFTIDSLDRDWPPLHTQYEEWAAQVRDEGWDRAVAYVTTTGDAQENTLERIVLHLVNHGSIHRGQIGTMVRQLGHKPPVTDLIEYYRSKRQ